jgi:hypothetical protein
MERHAEARWSGDLKTGKGSIRVGSGAFEGPASRGADTNPEEGLRDRAHRLGDAWHGAGLEPG